MSCFISLGLCFLMCKPGTMTPKAGEVGLAIRGNQWDTSVSGPGPELGARSRMGPVHGRSTQSPTAPTRGSEIPPPSPPESLPMTWPVKLGSPRVMGARDCLEKQSAPPKQRGRVFQCGCSFISIRSSFIHHVEREANVPALDTSSYMKKVGDNERESNWPRGLQRPRPHLPFPREEEDWQPRAPCGRVPSLPGERLAMVWEQTFVNVYP